LGEIPGEKLEHKTGKKTDLAGNINSLEKNPWGVVVSGRRGGHLQSEGVRDRKGLKTASGNDQKRSPCGGQAEPPPFPARVMQIKGGQGGKQTSTGAGSSDVERKTPPHGKIAFHVLE